MRDSDQISKIAVTENRYYFYSDQNKMLSIYDYKTKHKEDKLVEYGVLPHRILVNFTISFINKLIFNFF